MSVVSGEHVGRDDGFAYFGKLGELSGGTFRADPREIFASDRQVVVIHHVTGRRGEKAIDSRTALVFQMVDGRVKSFSASQEDQDAWEASFS